MHATDVAGSAGTPTPAARRHSPSRPSSRCTGDGESRFASESAIDSSFPPRTPRSPKRQLIPWNDRPFPGATRGRSQQGRVWRCSPSGRLALQRGAGSLQASAMRARNPLVGVRLRFSAHSTVGVSIVMAAEPSQAWRGRLTMGRATRPPNKGMQLTKLRAAPVLQAEVPPCARRSREPRTASQLIPRVRRTVGRGKSWLSERGEVA